MYDLTISSSEVDDDFLKSSYLRTSFLGPASNHFTELQERSRTDAQWLLAQLYPTKMEEIKRVHFVGQNQNWIQTTGLTWQFFHTLKCDLFYHIMWFIVLLETGNSPFSVQITFMVWLCEREFFIWNVFIVIPVRNKALTSVYLLLSSWISFILEFQCGRIVDVSSWWIFLRNVSQ